MNSTLARATAVVPSNFRGLTAFETECDQVFVTRELGCGCGSKTGLVKVTRGACDVDYIDPVLFECAKCRNAVVFFDSSRDGYDARLNGAFYDQGHQPVTSLCECGEQEGSVVCGLAYNVYFAEESPELVAEAQDYFDAIDIGVRCSKCSSVRSIGDWELA